MNKLMVSLFDYSGAMCRPWAEAGYYCVAVDFQHPGEGDKDFPKMEKTKGGGEIHYQKMDLSDPDIVDEMTLWLALDKGLRFIAAFPPCDNLAVSGARWFKTKGMQVLIDSLQLVENTRCMLHLVECPAMIENPVSTLSTYWRKPDYKFDPCDYAGYLEDPSLEAYTKKTCLWTNEEFVMPEKKRVEPVKVCEQGSWIQKLGGKSLKTKNLRSKTPDGFARAVFEANHK